MMGKKFTIIFAVLSIVMLSEVYGQDCSNIQAGYLVAEDSTRCTYETTELTLFGSAGSLIWQSSPSGVGAWTSLGVDYNTDTIAIVNPSENLEYRVIVTNGVVNCDTSTVVLIAVSTMSSIPETGFGETKCDKVFDPFAYNSAEPIQFWSKISGPGDVQFFPDSISADPTSLVVEEYGVYEIAWNISNGICTKDSVMTFTALEPPKAYAGEDTNNCGLSLNLSAKLSVEGSTGTWLGDMSFSNPNDPNTLASANPNSVIGYELRWREAIGAYCEDVDTVIVRIAAQPTGTDAGFGGDACDTIFRLNASLPNLGTGEWEFISDLRNVTIVNDGNNNTDVFVDEYGEDYKFQWKVTNAYCVDYDTVVVNFFEQPVSNAIPNENTCGRNAELFALPSVGDGAWSFLAGPAQPELFTKLNDSTTSVLIADGQYSEHTFQWKEVNAVCSDSAEVSFSFIEQPIANGGDGGVVCDHNFPLAALPSVGIGEWIVIDSIGNIDFLQGRNSSNTVIQIGDYGSYTFQWTEVNDICIDSSNKVSVIFHEQPEVEPFEDRYSCGFNFALTTDYSVDGASGSWEGNATFNTDEDSVLWVCTVNNSGPYKFLWTETNGDCFDTASILVNFIEQPDADISSEDSIACNPELNIITENSVGVGQWETISGPGTLSFSPDANSGDVIITSDSYGDFKIKWTLMNELCADSDSITISFIENPQVNAGPDQNLDNEFETTMQADLPASMIGEWELLSGTGDFNDLYSPESPVYNLSLGENMFSWIISNGACVSTDSVSIFIFDIFIPDLLTPNGDNDNDYFEISGIENIEPVEVTIFNRWGVEVYYSDNYQNDWDGTGKSGDYLTNDTYFYVVNINNEQRVFKGFVMLTE